MEFKRRDFLKSMAILGGAAALPSTAFAKVAEKDVPIWDEEWDVVIVGSGYAGTCAALTASEEGIKKILVMEKMSYPGGNSSFSAGDMNVSNSDLQLEKGFVGDSIESFFEDTMVGGRNLNDPDIVKVMVSDSLSTSRWLVKNGVKWTGILRNGGHAMTRSLSSGCGSYILRPLRERMREAGILIRQCVIMDELVYDANGTIIGIKVRENYSFDFNPNADENNNKTGRVKYYRAKGGVILATGGWGADKKFRDKMDPRVKGITLTTNHLAATGYTIQKLMNDNIKTIDMDQVQLIHLTSADEKSFGFGFDLISRAYNYGIMINPKTGKRFVSEMADRRACSDAIITMNENGKNHPIVIMDSAATNAVAYMDGIERAMEAKAVWKFNTMDELIKFFNINREPFLDQLKRYNSYVKNNKDPEFGRTFETYQGQRFTIEKAPFYASRPAPKVHHCMGGVQTTTQCHVINNNGNVINGLFAAGEVTGGRHGGNRLGANAVTDCTVYGRIAGRAVAKRLKNMAKV